MFGFDVGGDSNMGEFCSVHEKAESIWTCRFCNYAYCRECFSSLVRKFGLIYIDCGDILFWGASCEKCYKTTLEINSKRESELPIISLLQNWHLFDLYDAFQESKLNSFKI